jgi:hypothetical protein
VRIDLRRNKKTRKSVDLLFKEEEMTDSSGKHKAFAEH